MSENKLFQSIRLNNLSDVIESVNNGCDVNQAKPVFHLLKVIRLVYSRNTFRTSLFNYAYQEVSSLISNVTKDYKLDMDSPVTPLMWALILKKRKEIIDFLISAGGDVNYYPGINRSLLLYVLDNKVDSEIVIKIINGGANVNVQGNNGITPLMCAIAKQYDKKVIERLLLAGSDACGNHGLNNAPLMSVSCIKNFKDPINFDLIRTVECGRVCKNRENIISLLNYGADVNITDSDGNSNLHKSGICVDLINLLFSRGARLNNRNNKGFTPLMAALCRDDFNVFKTLLCLGANPNCYDNDFKTPLHKSIKEIYASLLLYYGADISLVLRYNRRPVNSLVINDYFHLGNHAIIKFSLTSENDYFIESIFKNETEFGKDWLHYYVRECRKEIALMKEIFITDNLALYDFCVSKIVKNNTIFNISESEYNHVLKEIEHFRNFNDFIKIRLDDNKSEKYKHDLIKNFDNLDIKTLESDPTGNCVYLNYDCLYEICRYLNHKQAYNLFCSSLL